jgi:hypothetical protein
MYHERHAVCMNSCISLAAFEEIRKENRIDHMSVYYIDCLEVLKFLVKMPMY